MRYLRSVYWQTKPSWEHSSSPSVPSAIMGFSEFPLIWTNAWNKILRKIGRVFQHTHARAHTVCDQQYSAEARLHEENWTNANESRETGGKPKWREKIPTALNDFEIRCIAAAAIGKILLQFFEHSYMYKFHGSFCLRVCLCAFFVSDNEIQWWAATKRNEQNEEKKALHRRKVFQIRIQRTHTHTHSIHTIWANMNPIYPHISDVCFGVVVRLLLFYNCCLLLA